MSRAHTALARLATLRARDAARAGVDRVSTHDAVLEQVGRQESETSKTSSARMDSS